MATDTAAAPARSIAPAPDPTRYVWQVPVFLLGLAVFVATWQGWLPLGTPDPAAAFMRDVDALRNAYERVTPDRDELKDLLGKVASAADTFPEHVAAARFALGSGYVRMAEVTPVPEEARGYWILARQHFELIRGEELRDPVDQPKLAFRAAKARAAVGQPPDAPAADLRLNITLLANVPFSEEPGEAGRLQADLAMRFSPPDLPTAREALTRYLTGTGPATPVASLCRAKLMLGDVHLQLREPELARKWLEQIPSDAPPEVIAPAKALLARVHQAEGDWLAAVREWEAVRATPGVPPSLRATSAYHLGVCKIQVREPEVAAKLFEEALKGGDTTETTASAIRLADLYLHGTDPAKRATAADLLVVALKGIPNPTAFRSQQTNVKLVEARSTFEFALATLMADAAYEPALKVVEAFAVIAEAGRNREKRAEILAAWATALEKSGADCKARAIAAAEEYAAVSGFQPAATAKAEMLRRAAAMRKLAGDPESAVTLLQTATRLPDLPDAAIGPVWVDLADALLAAKRPDEVWKAFNEAMAASGPVSVATRYRLARLFADLKRPEFSPLARALFEQIAQQPVVSEEEQENHERALVELAHELIRANNFVQAESWLSTQLSRYPTGPEASLGRLLLGVCQLQRASALPLPLSNADVVTAGRLRNEAIQLFNKIVADAEAKRKKDGKLNDRDSWLRLQAGLRILQCYQQLQKPNDLLAEADLLRQQHRGTIEELIILSLMYHAFKQKGETGKSLEIRDMMKEVFDRLPPSAFTAPVGEYSRVYWEKVWFAPDLK